MKEYQSTKRGKPVKPRRWNRMGFNWLGRDDRGISIWDGNPKALRLVSKLFVGIGIGVIVVSTWLFAVAHKPPGILGLWAEGLLFLGISAWMRRMDERLSQLVTAEQAVSEGADADRLDLSADGATPPRVIINGRAYYDPADLSEAARLLRASEPPMGDALLRAATSAPVNDEMLLHVPCDADPTAQTAKVDEPEGNRLYAGE